MKLREKYARSMEERLLSKDVVVPRILFLAPDEGFTVGPFSWEEIWVEEEELNPRKPQESLIYLRQKGLTEKGKLFFWLEAKIYLENSLVEEKIKETNDLNELLILCGCTKVKFGENRIGLNKEEDGEDWLEIKRDIIWNNQKLGVETRYFHPGLTKLIIPGELELGK